MDSLPAQPANPLPSEGAASEQALALRGLKLIFAAVFKRPAKRVDVVPGFEGYGWCDSCERQILDDLQRGR